MVHRRSPALAGTILAALIAALLVMAAPSHAIVDTVNRTGINGAGLQASNLWSVARTNGAGSVREFFTTGSSQAYIDSVVAAAANSGMTVFPVIDLAHRSSSVSTDISNYDGWLAWFAGRYGYNGAFWAEHPGMFQAPVRAYAIGNEPNCGGNAPGFPLDYSSATDYGNVYWHARNTLHAVNDDNIAVMGEILDSPTCTLAQGWDYLGTAIRDGAGGTPIQPDAVSFHPYVYDRATMEKDTTELVNDMLFVTAGFHFTAAPPVWVDEFDTFAGSMYTNATWGTATASYTKWALCSAGVRVVMPYWWGRQSNVWYAMTDDGALTSYGSAWLSEVNHLWWAGCEATPARLPRQSHAEAIRAYQRERARRHRDGFVRERERRAKRRQRGYHGNRTHRSWSMRAGWRRCRPTPSVRRCASPAFPAATPSAEPTSRPAVSAPPSSAAR